MGRCWEERQHVEARIRQELIRGGGNWEVAGNWWDVGGTGFSGRASIPQGDAMGTNAADKLHERGHQRVALRTDDVWIPLHDEQDNLSLRKFLLVTERPRQVGESVHQHLLVCCQARQVRGENRRSRWVEIK